MVKKNRSRFEYGVVKKDVPDLVEVWKQKGANPSLITLNESAPDVELILQGEVMRSTDYLTLRYSRMKTAMRIALALSSHHAVGINAVNIIKSAMDPASWDDLQEIFDQYEDAVVEFSTWSRDVGNCAFRNTVLWEVRNY